MKNITRNSPYRLLQGVDALHIINCGESWLTVLFKWGVAIAGMLQAGSQPYKF